MASEWRTFTLGEICDFRAGSVFKPTLQGKTSGDFPFVKVSDMNLPANAVRIQAANNWVSCEDVTELKAKPLPPGTVIFAKIGEALRQNRLRQLTRNTLIDNNMMGAIPSEDKVDPHYFYYALSQFDFADIAQGTALPYLTVAALSTLTLDFPPIDEQRAIAHILGTLDDKIELNRRQNETLEAMARALFKAWFVDFEPVRAKMEGRWQRGQSLPGLPAHLYDLFPDRLVESELGEIPEGWEIEELGAHLDVLESGRRPKGGVRGVDKGVPSVGAESITGVGQFEFGKTKYVSEEFFAAMKSGQVESMDVLLYKDGGKPGDFKPRVSMFGRGFPFERFAINEHVFRMRSRSLGQAFLYLQMSDERILFELRSRGGKAAIPGINQADVRTLLVIVPPRELLTTFDKAALPMMEGILDRAIEGRAIAQLRDTLLPKLISGDLRIAEVENFMGRIGV